MGDAQQVFSYNSFRLFKKKLSPDIYGSHDSNNFSNSYGFWDC